MFDCRCPLHWILHRDLVNLKRKPDLGHTISLYSTYLMKAFSEAVQRLQSIGSSAKKSKEDYRYKFNSASQEYSK